MSPPSLGSAGPAAGRAARHPPDSQLDSTWADSALATEPTGGRPFLSGQVRLLVGVALLVGLAVFALARELAGWPTVAAVWHTSPDGELVLVASAVPALQFRAGQALREVRAEGTPTLTVDAALQPRSARWIIGDVERAQQIARLDAMGRLLERPALTLVLGEGMAQPVPVVRCTVAGLGVTFWILSAIALAPCLAGALVVSARRTSAAGMYALLALCQAGSLLLMAAESVPVLGWPPGVARTDLALRTGMDLAGAAALLSACLLAPRQLPWRALILAAVWAVVAGIAAAAVADRLPQPWWTTQAAMLICATLGIASLRLATVREPRPYTALLWRLTIAVAVTYALLTGVVAAAADDAAAAAAVGTAAPTAWTLFFAALLTLVPFIVRARGLVTELALLAGAGTLAASLQLLLASRSGVGQAESLALALFLSALIYVASRPWLLGHLVGSRAAPSGDRIFESLYRAARDIERMPEQADAQVTRLLHELFDPQDIGPSARTFTRSRVSPDGSTLIVPLPRLPGAAATADGEADTSLRLRLAQRGTRLFTREDAQLIDRVMEQLRRAVAFDRAVEHGRIEERVRIAQDLHDDIGARLLTLMYKSQDPAMEEYLRHTLQDLKTLTRGLAASNHKLSHAAAEWKADLAQRLSATHCDMSWSFTTDREIVLTVTQWSALTRILRELVNNIISHAQASEVEVLAVCERGRMVLTVSDDGIGRQPESWAHGLGLGGVRKRVKALGGQVGWLERPGGGIRCEVQVWLRSDAA